jgi:hypothetical protein
LFAGCVSTGNSELASDQTMAQIRVGETTKQQVAALLGEPASQRTIEMGGWAREWWSYDHGSSVINVLDYIFLYGFFFNGIGLHDTRYDVGVFFDQRGVVSSLSRLKTDYDMGRPFSSKRVASSATKTMGFPDSSKAPVRFEDKAEYQY